MNTGRYSAISPHAVFTSGRGGGTMRGGGGVGGLGSRATIAGIASNAIGGAGSRAGTPRAVSGRPGGGRRAAGQRHGNRAVHDDDDDGFLGQLVLPLATTLQSLYGDDSMSEAPSFADSNRTEGSFHESWFTLMTATSLVA